MIQYKGKYYTVDAGTGCFYGFMRAPADANGTTQYAYRNIRGMFFSHLHQDHTTAYFDIMTIRWMTGGKEMLLAGPPYTSGLHKFLITFWKDDLAYRMLRRITQQNLTGPDVAAATIGMFDRGHLQGDARPADLHLRRDQDQDRCDDPYLFNLAYRFEVDGKSIVISGDTAYDPDLAILAKDVDILVVDGDAFVPGPNQPVLDPTKIAQKYQPVGPWRGNFKVGTHMNMDDLAKVLATAQPKKCVARISRLVRKTRAYSSRGCPSSWVHRNDRARGGRERVLPRLGRVRRARASAPKVAGCPRHWPFFYRHIRRG